MTVKDESTRAGVNATVVRYAKTRVEVVQGPDSGLAVETANKPIRVGTSSDNDLVLTDDTVSRRHCAIEPTEGGFRLRDEGSTNGVLLSGARVFDAVLYGASQLRLGDSVLAITPLKETVDREQTTADRFGDLLGRSPRMRELFADLSRIAPTDVTLLIEGETGTGKELVADSVHRASGRCNGPYVVFDCSAVAPTLAESELFGHERGAFTGAIASRPGVFEQADGGTIFLDELGELPRDLQPKLLRVLEKREVRRIGSQRTTPVNVRLIAATNRNMAAEVARGAFREDLYFRVAAAHVYVPPLRDRMEDLPMLVEHFLSLASPRHSLADVPTQVWEMFHAHRWPGNVRELNNAVQRFLVTPERALMPARDAETSLPPQSPAVRIENVLPLRIARREASDAFERDYLKTLLQRSEGNVTRAAAIGEVSRQMVQKLMRKHGLG
ncbi:MAG TPA: sigma 54-interacting transcriptional regulator [Polyangiaceae bacterium]|nr:sigma 54-interacting transcriptional regulator [Polyangiaceae bacterium]